MKTLLTTFLLLAAFNPVASNLNNAKSLLSVSYELYFHNVEFTPENLYDYLIICNISNADIVYRQALLESGRFTSNLFRKHNNLFGMCVAKYRETTSKDSVLIEDLYYATYSHWTESVKDYAIWQAVQSAKFSTANYYDFLTKSGYATNPEYIKILKGIK